MGSFHTEKYKKPPHLIKENFILKSINFIKEIFSWYFYQRETLEVKLKQKGTQIDDLKAQLNIVNHMYEEGRNLLKEQKRDLEEMLKVERKGANIPSLLQLDRKHPKIPQRSRIKINKLKAKIERLTKAGIPTALEGYYEIGLIDSFDLFRDKVLAGDSLSFYMSSVVHPNEKGHEIMANKIEPFLRQLTINNKI